jgi:hypothetical protein
MLRQHIPSDDFPYPFHQPGEVVLAAFGNYLEARERCTRKVRPIILLRTSQTQHIFAGLTTQPRYLTTREPRPVLPKPACLGLDGRLSHLWSPRPAFVSRLDLRRHLGWVDHEVVRFLARHLALDPATVNVLNRSATIHGDDDDYPPRKPR